MNRLFLIAHTDPDGEDKDLLVVAPDFHVAIGMWLVYYYEGYWSEVTWLERTPQPGFPPTTREAENALKIYEVNFDLDKSGPLAWFDSVRPVAWVAAV